MAKGKRSNSPKRSRRGGKRSPKKSKMGVQKKISKNESEPVHLREPEEVEEPNCECDLPDEAEMLQELPKMAAEVPVSDVETVKADLIKFFWESLEEDSHAGLKSVSQREEQFFLFGAVCAELAKSGKFTTEVESGLAMIWKADEAWIRSFLAGELELPKPEEPEAPEEQMETVEAEIVEEETVKEVAEEEVEVAEAEVEAAEIKAPEADVHLEEPKPDEVEVAAGVAAESPKAEVEDFAIMEDVVEDAPVEVPQPMEELVQETLGTENTATMIEEAVKTVSSKLGEQSADVAAPLEGLVPKDLNLVQPTDLA
jgi:hypothetical protein